LAEKILNGETTLIGTKLINQSLPIILGKDQLAEIKLVDALSNFMSDIF